MFRRSSRCDTSACVEVDVDAPFQRSTFCESAACVQVGFQRSSSCDATSCVEVGFHKSTASATSSECVEVGFHKATASNTSDCVEVGTCNCDKVLVRDSKDVNGPLLKYSKQAWSEFLAGAKVGEFDLWT